MAIGQTVKKGFSTAGSSWDLVAVLFGFGLVWNLINLGLSARVPAEGNPDAATAAMLIVAGVLFVLLTIFFQSGSLGYVRDKVKTGTATLQTFSASGRRYYVSILAVAAVVTLILGVFVLLAALVSSAFTGNLQPLAVVFALLLAALGLSFVVMLFLAPYIVVADGAKARPAMSTSMKLVKSNVGPILGLSLILILIGFGIGLILGAIFAGMSLVLPENVSQVVFAVLSSAVNAYLGVVVSAAFMTFYLALPKNNN